MKEKLEVQGLTIAIHKVNEKEYLSLTDIARRTERDPNDVLREWLSNQDTLSFLETWERIHNPDFKPSQMGGFRQLVSDKRKALGAQTYIRETGAIGITSIAGRYGGTYVHPDIALHFCNWLSPEFYAWFLHEFQVMKEQQASLEGKRWNLRRELAASNYFIHTDAVRENLIPLLEWNTKREAPYFASEADLLNLAVFGMTAKQFNLANPDAKGNLRDHATEAQLRVMANMESANALLLEQDFNREERFVILCRRAQRELDLLESKALTTTEK